MTIYMKYGKIKGAVEIAEYKEYIELTSFHWGAGRHIGSAKSGSTERDTSEPDLNEVTVTKVTDIASPDLVIESIKSDLDNTVTIKFTEGTALPPPTYLTYELSNCGVSSYEITSSGDKPTEHLSLNFTKVMKSYVNPITKSPNTVTYDMTAATEK